MEPKQPQTEYALEELLPYEQPTPYIVNSTDYSDEYTTPVLTAGKSFILGYTNETNGIYDSLPVIIFDDFTTASQYVDFPFKVKSSAMKILSPNTALVLPKYIYYRLQTIEFDHSTHKRYWIQQYSKIKIAIPSLSEQERIVAKIEELFSELDNAVVTLEKAKRQLAVYRQAVLINSFSEIPDVVDMGTLADMVDPQPSHRTPPEVADGIPYIGIGDIDYEHNKINFSDSRKVAIAVLSEHHVRYTVRNGDFIMGKIGTIGKPFQLPLPQNYALSANVILIQPKQQLIIPEFLFWQFASPLVVKQLISGATATSQPAFGIKKARKIKIRVCNIAKQEKLLSDINMKISMCDGIEKSIDAALQQALMMRHSILKQAFTEVSYDS